MIELKKEIHTDCRMWYSIYYMNRYVGGTHDYIKAEKMFEQFKELIREGESLDPKTIKKEKL